MEYYLWIKSLHIIAVIAWMAGVFYLPRLLVYHAENMDNDGFVKVVTIQEYKLYHYITKPAMWLSLVSGIGLIYIDPSILQQGWLHAKIVAIVLLIIYTFSLHAFAQLLQNKHCKKGGKFFRAYNELPTVLLIIIVIMVVVKPFE